LILNYLLDGKIEFMFIQYLYASCLNGPATGTSM